MTQNQSLSILGQIAPATTGTAGKVLTSNGSSSSYWSIPVSWSALAATNTAIRVLTSDRLQVANAVATYLTKNNPVITGTLTANGAAGTAGYYLRTSGTGIYWSPVSAGGGSAANGFSGILVGANVVSADSTTDRLTLVAGTGINIAANPTTDTITFTSTGGFSGGTVSGATTFSSGVTLNSTLTANGSTGTSGYYLRTSGTGVYWSPASSGTASLTALRQSFTGDGSTTVFTVSGGYTASAIDVFVNGLKFRNGTDVTVTSGTTITFAIAPPSGALIDVVGNVPTTFTTFATSGFGAYFNGSSNITVGASSALSFGTGDFTIEMWVYPTAAITGNEVLYGYRSGSDNSPYLMLNPSLGVNFGGDVSNWLSSGVVPTLNTWTHIAVARSSTSLKMFVNGSQVASITNSTNFSDASVRYIGQSSGGNYQYTGYISNLRIVKGTAVYTSAFTTPTSPLTAISGTSLLTLNSSTIVDNGPNALSLTNNGGVTVSSAVAPVFTTYTLNGGTSTVNISDTFVSVFLLGL